MSRRSGFVDFMFAVTVGATFSNLGNIDIDKNTTEFVVVSFFIFIVLEDYFLYHTHVVPMIKEDSSSNFIILLMESGILLSWYLSSTFAEKAHQLYSLIFFATYSILKFLAGSMHWFAHPDKLDWRCWRYICFLAVPIFVSFHLSDYEHPVQTEQLFIEHYKHTEHRKHIEHHRQTDSKSEDSTHNEELKILSQYEKNYLYVFLVWITQTCLWWLITKAETEKLDPTFRTPPKVKNDLN
jgi:hypothetical protein